MGGQLACLSLLLVPETTMGLGAGLEVKMHWEEWRIVGYGMRRGEAVMARKKSQDAFSESVCWLSCQKRGFSEGSEVHLSMSGQG